MGSQQTSTPPVRWIFVFLQFFCVFVQLSVSLRATSGSADPWGENQRPKLYTDYLTELSGKTFYFLKHFSIWQSADFAEKNQRFCIKTGHFLAGH
jgi:hypothetical protein